MHRWCPVMLNALSKSFTCSLILILIRPCRAVRVWLRSLNLRTYPGCVLGQLSPHRILFRLCLLHHVSDFGRLENFTVRQSAWSLRCA